MMKTNNTVKLQKYIPVRKQLKDISKTNVCQKQAVNGGRSGAKTLSVDA
jgi:hypothetical protein